MKRNCAYCIHGAIMVSRLTLRKKYVCCRKIGGKERKKPIWCPWFKKKKF